MTIAPHSDFFEYKRDSGGVQVWRRDRQIEHYSGSLLDNGYIVVDSPDLRELRRRCEHLESIGVPVTQGTVIHNWPRFKDLTRDSRYYKILTGNPSLYEHGLTALRKRKLAEANIPSREPFAADGSCLLVYPQNVAIQVSQNGNVVKPIDMDFDRDVFDSRYHYLESLGYYDADCGQKPPALSYTVGYDGIAEWFERFGIDEETEEMIMANYTECLAEKLFRASKELEKKGC